MDIAGFTHMKTTVRIAVLLAVALAGGCATVPAEDDPVVLRLQSLERRLDAIERILANGSLVDLTLQMDDLQRQAADLQGRVERMEYEQEGSAGRQRALYADLDERIQSLESGLQRAGTGIAGADDELPVPNGTDQQNYQAAFELLKEQRYDQAAAAFSQFLSTYPDSQLADNAQYWLAESYYVSEEFERALDQFRLVIDRYPRSRKVPDAQLKIGYCNYELENWPEARIALSQVQADFPDSTAARLAEQRERRMTEEGH